MKKFLFLVSVNLIISNYCLAESNYQSIHTEISANEKVAKQNKYNKVKKNLSAALMRKLRARTKLVQANTSNGADLVLKIKIISYRYRSQGARIFLGAAAGRSYLKANIQLVDTKNRKILWNTTTTAKSKASHGVFGKSSTVQIENLANQVIIGLGNFL